MSVKAFGDGCRSDMLHGRKVNCQSEASGFVDCTAGVSGPQGEPTERSGEDYINEN